MYSPELVSAQKELAIAEAMKLDAPGADPAAREGARRLAQAARERLANWNVGPAAKGKDTQRLTFSSPANGVVLEKMAVAGTRFTPGMPVYRIADLSKVWVIADVYEQDLARVKVGEAATVVVDAFPDRAFKAKVAYLYPTLSTPTRTTAVRLELDNRGGLLRPGMFAHVELATAGGGPRLAVPTSAVIDTGRRQVVLEVLGEGRFKPREVRVGLWGRDHAEILQGIEAGTRVVVAANFLIDAESNLKAALATFSAGEEEGSGGAAAGRHEARGTLDAVDAAAGTVSITHEAVPALKWPGMTMEFGLAAPQLARGIAPGTPIRFEFEDRGNGEFVVTAIAPQPAHGGH